MADNETPPIKVSENAPVTDTLAAALRYLVVLATMIPAVLSIFKTGDVLQIIDFMRGESGSGLIAAVVGIGTIAYGLFRTNHRATQITNVASSDKVPNSVASLK